MSLEVPRNGSPARAMAFGWLRSVSLNLVQLTGATLVLQAGALAFPLANQVLVDRILVPRQMPWLLALAGGLVAVVLAQGVVSFLRGWVLQGLHFRAGLELTDRFLVHHLRLPLGRLAHLPQGEVFDRIRTVERATDLFRWKNATGLLDITTLSSYLGLMLLYDLRLTGLVLIQALSRVALVNLFRIRLRAYAREEQRARESSTGALLEIMSGLETIRASGGQALAMARFRSRLKQRVEATYLRKRVNLLIDKSMVLLGGVSQGLLFWAGGRAVLQERMTLGALLAFIALQRLFSEPLESRLRAMAELQALGPHLDRMDEVLVQEPEPARGADPGILRGEIVLEGVGFRFEEGGPWILQDLDLHIPAGSKIALVGLSGAGKSTLARLLLGMYPPTRGRILYDGQDLRGLDLERFRQNLGVVPQESFLLNESIRINLSLRRPGATLEEIRRAARMAEIDHVIARMPMGYDQRLGEEGWSLSGGERQRLMIARALVGDPRILLMDEATSALDLDTEARVHGNLSRVGCTRVLIAHRLATVRDADRILVLEGGRLTQDGPYEELATRPGLFRNLVQAMEGGPG